MAAAAARMLGAVLERADLRRFVVAPLTPGAPLCRILAPGRRLDGCETVLKGGQMGGPAFFAQARAGRV